MLVHEIYTLFAVKNGTYLASLRFRGLPKSIMFLKGFLRDL